MHPGEGMHSAETRKNAINFLLQLTLASSQLAVNGKRPRELRTVRTLLRVS